MKVTNWCKKLVATIVAGSALSSSLLCHAVNIPLGDPSFDAYIIPSGNYAYAADPHGAYRPTIPWVDDLDSPTGYNQDDHTSNWLYNGAYAEDGPPFRAAPRTGPQAMHGLFNYNAQETSATFAAEKYYTFSGWAQGDNDASATTSGVFLYVFRTDLSFSGETALAGKLFTQGANDFNNRVTGSTSVQSQANWRKISVSHAVFPDSPEIGQNIGVGFFLRRDSALEDVTLEVDDAVNHLLVLEVNTTNGQTRVRNQTGSKKTFDYYEVASTGGALNATGWNSLQEQNLAGFPAGNGSGNGWEQAGGSTSTAIGESYLTGNSSISSGANVGLGAAYNVGGAHDLVFRYGTLAHPTGDYNDNGVVDAADFVVWRKAFGQNLTLPNDSTSGTVTELDYIVWREHFGEAIDPNSSTLVRGLVHYVTSFSGSGLGEGIAAPEPGSVFLIGIGMTAFLAGGRRTSNRDKNSV